MSTPAGFSPTDSIGYIAIKTRHGMEGKRLWVTWKNMRMRCNPAYGNSLYGLRGITVCKEWKKFTNFQKWAISAGYSDELFLDRIDSNGNYEPSNCRFVTLTVQANNKRSNILITINGITDTRANWARKANIAFCTLRSRIKRGWEGEKLLSPPAATYIGRFKQKEE